MDKEILNSNSYTITKIDCDNNKTKLDNSIMNKIDSTWKELSNNGPWLEILIPATKQYQ